MKKFIVIPILILLILFTSTFISLVSIYTLPEKIMGSGDTYVLLPSKDRNPLRSNLDIDLAYELENMSYITSVSPEIFVFTVIKDKAVTIRGVEFSKFLKIENGSVIMGSMPRGPMDALVGENLYHYLGLHIGQSITIPGSFTPSVAVVNITGVFYTGTLADDEILISIPTAQKLAGIRYGQVSIIRFKTNDAERANKLIDATYPKFVGHLNITGNIYYGERFNVTINLENLGSKRGICHVNLITWNRSISKEVVVDRSIEFNVTLTAPEPGTWNVTMNVGNDVLNYTVFSNFTVLPRPVIFKGGTLVYTHVPSSFVFLSKNGDALDGMVVVKGEGYSRSYEINGTLSIVFPKKGNYTLSFRKIGYENKTIHITALDKLSLDYVKITPEPVNGVIYLKRGSNITIWGNYRVYYSLDGGLIRKTTGNITIPWIIQGDHKLNIMVMSNQSMGNKTYILHIYDDPEVHLSLYPYKYAGAYHNTSFNITVYSEIPLKNYSLWVNGKVRNYIINQSFRWGVKRYFYNIALFVDEDYYLNLSVYVENYGGHGNWARGKIRVIYPTDVEKPKIIFETGYEASGEKNFQSHKISQTPLLYEASIKIWGGNTTVIKAVDNTKIRNISVYVFGRYFNSTTGDVSVFSVFRKNNTYLFMKEGLYYGVVNVTDFFGNINITTFQIIINNTGEKLAPLLIIPKTINFRNSTDSYNIRAFDNVGVSFLGVYENGSLVKSVSSQGFENITLCLNYSDLSDGLHNLTIVAKDINGNERISSLVATKNYIDLIPPELKEITKKVWSGERIEIKAFDNVKVDNIIASIFNHTYVSSDNVIEIPTMWIDEKNKSIEYISEGKYVLNLTIRDVNGNVNKSTILIEVNNTNETLPPHIFLPNELVYNATDYINFTVYDNVGVRRVWISDSLGMAFNTTLSNFSCLGEDLGYGTLKLEIYAEDVNGNVISLPFTLIIRDNVFPKVLNTTFTLWGGNYTNITFWDNHAVESGSIRIFNRTFYARGDRVEIRTKFKEGKNIRFVPSGTYIGEVSVRDMAGNVNTTYITIVIDNRGERNPPVITGGSYQIVSNKTDAVFYAFDNVGVSRMWWTLNGTVMGSSNSSSLLITFQEIPLGTNYIKVYAQDVNGNVAEMDAVIDVLGKPEVKVYAYLLSDSVESTERGVLTVVLENGANSGNYTLYIYLDGEEYYNITESMNSFETRTLTINLPYLSKGEHTIVVGNQILTLKVYEPPVEKVPIDLILKYNKDLKVTATETVIYKGFQISQGNFILVIFSLMVVGIILGALGMYSSMLKAINNKNIAILRAIGASNRTLMKFAVEDVVKYILPSIFGGLLLGYALVGVLEWLNVLRAFGHGLVVDITPQVILGSILISLGFLAFTAVLILKEMFHSKVVHLFGGERSEKIYTLEEILNER